MRPAVVLIGTGGQGREIGRMLLDAGHDLVGYVDDGPSELNLERVLAQGVPFLGGRAALGGCGATHYVTGIAAGRVRELFASLAADAGLEPLTFVHETATVGSDCVIGAGSVVWPRAALTTNVRIGREVHVNQGVTLGHDTVLDDFATVNPAAAISGNVAVGRRALVGAASVVLQELAVGDDATVGAAACVTRPVPAGAVVVGVPARWLARGRTGGGVDAVPG